MTIKRELSELPGVLEVEGDLDSKNVSVKWAEPANWEKISTLLEEINYPPEL
jgi:copper chaperone CopZ